MKKYVFLPGGRGFTLIELMVVVAIIGILMAAGIVAFSDVQKNARDARRKADVDAIAKAAEMYYQDNQNYAVSALTRSSTDPGWTNAEMITIFGDKFPFGSAPKDPMNTATYKYDYVGIAANYSGAANKRTRFCVSARLEQGNGNCTGNTGAIIGSGTSFQCAFTTLGTGTHYCAQERQ